MDHQVWVADGRAKSRLLHPQMGAVLWELVQHRGSWTEQEAAALTGRTFGGLLFEVVGGGDLRVSCPDSGHRA